MVAGNPCYSGPPPSLPERTTSAATQYVKPRTGVAQPIVLPQPGEQVRITVGSCYGPESPLPQVGGNIAYTRPRKGVEPEPPAPVNPIQITVGNCYIPGEPPRAVVPQEAGSPAVSTPRPRQGTLITPPAAQPGDLVRSIVDNCYDGQPVTLKPDPGPYLPRPKKEIELEPIPPNGSDVIRDLVGQCYGPIGPFLGPRDPDDPGSNYPRPRKGLEEDPPHTDPGEVIREIVQRCYPEIVPTPHPPPGDPDPRTPPPLFPDPPPWEWLCELFPYLSICEQNPGPLIPPMPPYDGPRIPDGFDCNEVELAKLEGVIKRYEYPKFKDRWIYIKGPKKGKILICDDREIPTTDDPEWEKCVKNYLDCLFKPYATGTYRSPPADCDTFYFRGQNSITKKICVANCFPERIPVYEYKTAGVPNVMVTPVADALGNGTGSFVKHNLRVQTTDVAGNYTGGKVFVEAGNKYFNSATTHTRNVSVGGATVTVKIQSINDNGEYDSIWWVDGFSGNLPAIGTEVEHTFNAGKRDLTFKVEVIEAGGSTSDHRYGLTSQPDKGGYTVTNQGEPAFYILKERVRGTVPLFRSYSETTQDTFLTINPGAPDSKGPGERATMDAAGQVIDTVLGYVFPNKDLASGNLVEGERIQELHRYYNGGKAEISAIFNSSGNIVVSGDGSGQLKINVQWDDNPGIAGTSFDTIDFGQGQTVTRKGERGSKGVSLNVTAGQTINVNYTGLKGLSVEDNGKKLCLRDNDGSDCNASLFIGSTRPGPSTATDHKYSIVKMQGSMTPPKFNSNRQAYTIPSDADVPFTIHYSVKKGSAGYENSWGVCIADRDGGNIHWARVIEANTTRDIEYTQYTISVGTLKQYAGKDIVFFLIPDGNGGVGSNGSSISFSKTGNAYQHPASVEGNWVFFANQKMNPDQRNKVKFHGPGEQWWEDLHGSDSDEDYDDFKLYYRVGSPGSTWKYEGIECYVYDQAAPAPELIDILVRDQCAEPLFNKAFETGMVMRSKCGPKTPPNKNTEKYQSNAGLCRGEYAHEFYRRQTVRCRRSANLSLKAFGLLIRSVESEEIRFRFKLKKNGTTIINYEAPIGAWPQIGHNFGDFSVVKGDKLLFEIDEIKRGPSAGMSTVSWIIYDRDDRVFEKPWQYDIGTTPITGEAMGRTEVTSNTPRIGEYLGSAGITTGGRIKKLSIRLWDKPRRQWTDKVYVWDQGQIDTNANSSNGQAVEWNNIYYDGQEWADNQGYNGNFYERNANRRGHVMSSNIDGEGNFNGNPNVRGGRGIFYNALFEYGRGLICKPVLDNENLRTYVHMSNTHGFMAWYTQFTAGSPSSFNSAMNVIDNYYAAGINQSSTGYPQGVMVGGNGQYSKMSFMHDYRLGEYGSKQNSTDVGGSGKIRVAFWPYTVMPSHLPGGTQRYSNSIYWACGVEIMDVINEGYAYGVGQAFDLVWPPIQDESDDYQDLAGSQTPFFPRDIGANVLPGHPDKLPNKIRVQTVGEDPEDRFNNSYSPKELFYQESHNRSSNLWYLCQKTKDRVKFRIEIEEVY